MEAVMLIIWTNTSCSRDSHLEHIFNFSPITERIKIISLLRQIKDLHEIHYFMPTGNLEVGEDIGVLILPQMRLTHL